MHEKQRQALAKRMGELAAKLRSEDPGASSRSMSFRAGEEILHLVGEETAEFDELCRDVLRESRWHEKYSESHVKNLFRDALGLLYQENTKETADELLTGMASDYDSYQKEHVALVPLFGIELTDSSLEIGRITIKKLSNVELRQRLGVHGQTVQGTNLADEFSKNIMAEYSAIAEPERANQRALEEVRRAVDVLRYAIPFFFPGDYKQMQMNVGIQGEHPHGGVFCLTLPAVVDHSITFSSYGTGPALALTLNAERLRKLDECGAMTVSAILQKPVSQLTNFERVLLRGIHWFGNALCQSEPENELLSLITCLETFLTPKDGNPIGTAIADGVVMLLEKGLEERKRLKKRVKDLYRNRSAVSHGGEKAVLESDLVELREIAKRTVRRMIEMLPECQSQKDVLDWIEDKKLG